MVALGGRSINLIGCGIANSRTILADAARERMKMQIERVVSAAIEASAGLLTAVFLVSTLIYLHFGHWTVTHLDFWRIYDVCLNHS
jgi:hypothetical protein